MPVALERNVLSVNDVHEAFIELNDDALCDIHAAAGRLAPLSSFFDSSADLVHEALTNVLDGRRTIPSDVSFVAAFIMIMKSLASHEVKKARRLTSIEDASEISSPMPSPERAAVAANMVHKLKEAFAEDEEVTAILLAREEGWSLPKVARELDIDLDKLEAGRKRLIRWIEYRGWKTEE